MKAFCEDQLVIRNLQERIVHILLLFVNHVQHRLCINKILIILCTYIYVYFFIFREPFTSTSLSENHLLFLHFPHSTNWTDYKILQILIQGCHLNLNISTYLMDNAVVWIFIILCLLLFLSYPPVCILYYYDEDSLTGQMYSCHLQVIQVAPVA